MQHAIFTHRHIALHTLTHLVKGIRALDYACEGASDRKHKDTHSPFLQCPITHLVEGH